jgi:hypothetical protein
MGFHFDLKTTGSWQDRTFYDGINLMLTSVYLMFLFLVIDVQFLGGDGGLTLLSVIIGVPIIAFGYFRVRLFFTERSCPSCGAPVRMDQFQCPKCGDGFLGIP